MDSSHWDERYAASDLVWSATPNMWVEQLTADLTPGTAVDLAGGEGRNALWLAERGWQATVVDFSQVALDRAQQWAAERLGADAHRLRTEQADLLAYAPPARAYDLVLVVYLQVPADQRRPVMRAAAEAVAPGGRLLIVAHDTENLSRGVGGPQAPEVLYSPADLLADLAGTGLTIDRAETVERPVQSEAGLRQALDALVVAIRPEAGGAGER
ncbi:MAG: class I SAM-dependent methyltransferase [Actinobacteria bacterium]|nr:class I SAM-dependent methyltransferase [Actinomycetota bacterium]